MSVRDEGGQAAQESQENALAGISEADRFVVELEFVQNLANPAYLHFLAQHRYFENERFINFLRYLRYWKEPQYAKFLMFPHCLAFLDTLIDNEEFRKDIAQVPFRDEVHQQQYKHWKFFSQEPKILATDQDPSAS